MTQYVYPNQVVPELLEAEIQISDITIAVSHIDTDNTPSTTVVFKTDLSVEEVAILDTIVSNHDMSAYLPEVLTVKAEFKREVDDEKIPYVYSSPRPMNHYSYFTSKGDGTAIGNGNSMLFSMLDTDVEKSVDLTFNELVYLKDGLVHCKNAPFGATVDISVVHPLYGILLYFGKEVPVYGDYPITLDTEDRASLPQGLSIRVTVRNSTGLNGEDAPQAFKIFGRLELYRPKPPGV